MLPQLMGLFFVLMGYNRALIEQNRGLIADMPRLKKGGSTGRVFSEQTRARIKASQLVTRLENHALGKLKKPMTPDQIQAANILLRHAIAPQQAVDPDTGSAEVTTKTVIKIGD